MDNLEGMLVFDDNEYVQRFTKFHQSDSDPRKPDVLIFNSGLHDIANSLAEKKLKKHLPYIQSIGVKTIIKTSNPKIGAISCSGLGPDSLGNAAVHYINTILKRVAKQSGIDVLDQNAILMPRSLSPL